MRAPSVIATISKLGPRPCTLLGTLLGTLLASIACTHEKGPEPPKIPVPTIEAYSEPTAVTALVPFGSSLFVGTSVGIDRWETASGKRRRLGAGDGVTGATIRGLVLGAGGQLWFATDAGVGRYDIDGGRALMMPAPAQAIAAAVTGMRALAADNAGGGVWVAGTAGLFHVDSSGFTSTTFKGEVTALYAAPGGELWIGTRDGVVRRSAGGVFTPEREGSTLKNIVAIGEGPDGAPIAIGDDGEGHSRIAAFLEGQFTTYRLSTEARITQAAHRQGGLVIQASGRLLTLFNNDHAPVGLHRNGVHLQHVTGKHKKSPYTVGVFDLAALEDVTAVATSGQTIFLGTRTLGTARLVFDEPPRTQVTMTWLRPRELVLGARSLFAACQERSDCYLATGGMTAWHYDGRAFAPLVIGDGRNIVLAVVRDQKGEVLALYRAPSERMLHVAKLVKGAFTPVTEIRVETPSGATILSFAKFAADGLLWLGLQYLDEEGDPRPYGVAIVDLAVNGVSYHHEGKASRKTGVLPIPNDVVDVAFLDDETWFASGSGAARLKGEALKVWTEADELRSEILHGVVATEGGVVYVASSSGVGQFDGGHWSYPPALSIITNGIARGRDGKLWLGTDRGIVAYDGKKTERYDRRAGLADDRVLDLTVDYLGRVWARSPEGVSIITPP